MRRIHLITIAASLALVALSMLTVTACGTSSSGGGGNAAKLGTPPGPKVDMLQKAKDAGKLVVALDANYKPQSYQDPSTGEFRGFDVAVAAEIAKRLGLKVEYITPVWDTIPQALNTGRFPIQVNSMTITRARAKILAFPAPYYYGVVGICVRKGNPLGIDGVESLAGKKVGTGAGTTYDFYLNWKAIKHRGYESEIDAMTDVNLGRLDAAVLNIQAIASAIGSGKYPNIEQAPGDPLFQERYAPAIAHNQTPLNDAVKKAIEEMHADGTLSKLAMKWHDGHDDSNSYPNVPNYDELPIPQY